MAIAKQITKILCITIFITQSSAMKIIGRYAMITLAKRSAVLRTSVMQTPRISSVKIASKIAPQSMRRSFSNFKRTSLKSAFNGLNRKKSAGIALGFIGTAVCAGQSEDKEADAHKDPFQKSRKQFYASLQAKPWGQVAKKYIDELQEEEQELMREFFATTKITPEEWDALLLKTYAQGKQSATEAKASMARQIPEQLKKDLDIAAQECCIDPSSLSYVQDKALIPIR